MADNATVIRFSHVFDLLNLNKMEVLSFQDESCSKIKKDSEESGIQLDFEGIWEVTMMSTVKLVFPH